MEAYLATLAHSNAASERASILWSCHGRCHCRYVAVLHSIMLKANHASGLGGGGLATPQTSNIATAINYTMLAVCCCLGGPIVNKLGTKWSLVLGACSFPIRGSSYYCNSKFGNQWYLILGGFFTGIGTGTWYVAESGTIMSLAPSQSRGKYLALWIVARNLGQLVGGAIK